MARRYASWLLFAVIGCCSAVAAFAVGRLLLDRLTRGTPEAVVPAVVELGDHERDKIVTGLLRVANTGTAELVLERFAVSCSCAAVHVERDGELRPAEVVRVPPGGQVELAARVTVIDRPGTSQRVYVAFSTNDPAAERPTVELVVGRVLGGVTTAPLAVVLGDQPSGAAITRRVRVYANGVKGRRLSVVRSLAPDRFSTTLLPSSAGQVEGEVDAGLIGVIEVVPVTGRVGPLDGRIEVRVADEQRPSDYIEVLGRVVGPVVTMPDAVVLPRAAGGKMLYDGRVHVWARDGKPVAVTAEPAPDGWKVSVAADPDSPGRQSLLVSRSSGAQPVGAPFVVKLNVTLDGGQVVPVTVPVHVRGGTSHE